MQYTKEQLLKDYLENEEGFEVESINPTGWDNDILDVNEGEREYLVIPQEKAWDYVYDYIKDCIDDIGFTGTFTSDFVDSLLYTESADNFFYDTVKEQIEYDLNELQGEDLVDYAINELGMNVEGYYGEAPDGELDEEALRDDCIDNELDDIDTTYVQWLTDRFGWDFVKDLIDEHWEEIFDLNEVVDKCIDADGEGHFLSPYDGIEIQLSSTDELANKGIYDIVAYRVN